MAKSCMNPDVKKALLERLGDKCDIDDSGICEIIESFPECGASIQRVRAHRNKQMELEGVVPLSGVRTVSHRERQLELEDIEPMKRQKVKKPRKLSEYQKHMSACLLANEGFNVCIQKWRSKDSMADEYKGSGVSK